MGNISMDQPEKLEEPANGRLVQSGSSRLVHTGRLFV